MTIEKTREKGGGKSWWARWSPYWESYEDQYLGSRVIKYLSGYIESPVLLIGAGQGLLLENLKKKGLSAFGIDYTREMIKAGTERRGVKSSLADARALPFGKNQFKTVIIASGVIDTMAEVDQIRRIADEAMRVTSPFGNLIVGFYQFSPVVEKTYRRLGALDDSGIFHMRRIFDISRDTDPRRCVPMICRWTGRSTIETFLWFTYTGITLPRYLRGNDKKLKKVIEAAAGDGIGAQELIESVPAELPYRKAPEIRDLLDELGMEDSRLDYHDDCITSRYYKSPLFSLKQEVKSRDEKKGEADGRVAIETHDLRKRYGKMKRPAVNRLNLSIEEGTIFGILGPNGAGKTTTLMMLCGLLKPTGGSVSYHENRKYLSPGSVKRRIGYVPQDLALYQKLTARENLLFFGGLYDLSGEKLNERAGALLSLVGLKERADEQVSRYSSGMKRRLNLAAGLIHEPTILLLDEPTAGIDPQSRNSIFESVMELRERGVTILYTTHYMEEASRLCDRVAIMDEGKVLLEGPPDEMVSRYGLGRLVFKTRSEIPSEFIRKLSDMEYVFEVEVIDDRLTISTIYRGVKNINIIEEITRQAAKHKIDLSLTNFYEPTLESLFLDITGRSFRDYDTDSPDARSLI